MKLFFKNRYIRKAIKTVLVLVAIHMIALAVFLLKTGKLEVFNVFNIVGLNLLIPELGKGFQNFILSFILLAILYCGVFIL